MQLFSLENGELLGIMPDGVIQQTRVAITSALGAQALCRPEATRLGLIGTGGQARAHFRLLTHVLPIDTVKVYSPRPDHREAFAEEMGRTDGIEVEPTGSVASAIAGCDIVCTATSTSAPIISGDMLEPGMHYNAIREFEHDDTVFAKADITGIHTAMGGIRHHLPPGVDDLPGIRQEKPRDWSVYPEISDFLSGRAPAAPTPTRSPSSSTTSASVSSSRPWATASSKRRRRWAWARKLRPTGSCRTSSRDPDVNPRRPRVRLINCVPSCAGTLGVCRAR